MSVKVMDIVPISLDTLARFCCVFVVYVFVFGSTVLIGCKRNGAKKTKKKTTVKPMKREVKSRPQKKPLSSVRSPAPTARSLPAKPIVQQQKPPPAIVKPIAKVETPKPSSEVKVEPTFSKNELTASKTVEKAPEQTVKTSMYVRRGLNGSWRPLSRVDKSEFSLQIDSNDLTDTATA
ncbi:hypothetical protein M3Y98_01097100 [Aphelenchoides besseyi]|nr:hypothetical protein M3Y98_01097100 [Aphelenchoides besseyi]KAI6209353.1 hypothetical protein M3Y96_00212700 [Aphelenchoides besseyi]